MSDDKNALEAMILDQKNYRIEDTKPTEDGE